MTPLFAITQWAFLAGLCIFAGIVIGYVLNNLKRKAEAYLKVRGWLKSADDGDDIRRPPPLR